jgi:hypothetical protein
MTGHAKQHGSQPGQQLQQQQGDRVPASRAALAADAEPPTGSMRRISSAAALSASAGQAVSADNSADAADAEMQQDAADTSAEEDAALLPYSPAASPSRTKYADRQQQSLLPACRSILRA